MVYFNFSTPKLQLDITSWWLTKINPHFALLVVVAGFGLGLAFAYMRIASMYQMWFLSKRLKKMILNMIDAMPSCVTK